MLEEETVGDLVSDSVDAARTGADCIQTVVDMLANVWLSALSLSLAGVAQLEKD